MKNSLNRIVGGGFALATAVALTVPGMASAAGSLDLGSLSDSLGGDGVSAPTVTAEVSEDSTSVDITLTNNTKVTDDADVDCAAYIIDEGGSMTPDEIADGIVGNPLSLATNNHSEEELTASKTLATTDLAAGDYKVVSACWADDNGSVVDGSAVAGQDVNITFAPATVSTGGGIFGSLGNIFGSLGA